MYTLNGSSNLTEGEQCNRWLPPYFTLA